MQHQPEACASNLGDDQSHYLWTTAFKSLVLGLILLKMDEWHPLWISVIMNYMQYEAAI